MGRRKIKIEPITDERNRKVTFVKRKAGLFKKAHELAILCQVDLAVVILGHNNSKFYEYSSVKIEDLLQNFDNVNFTHEVKQPRDYDKEQLLISRVKGASGANSGHQRSISTVSASMDGDQDEDDDDDDEDDEDNEEEDGQDDDSPSNKRRRTVKQETSSSFSSSSKKMDSRYNDQIHSVSIPAKSTNQRQQQQSMQLPMQHSFPVTQNLPFNLQQQPQQHVFNRQQQFQTQLQQLQQQQHAQAQQQMFTEVVPVSNGQVKTHFSPSLPQKNTQVTYNPDIPFLNQLSPMSSFVMNGSTGLSPFASPQTQTGIDRARRLNNNISKRPPLRVEIPDSTNFTLPARSNDLTSSNAVKNGAPKDSPKNSAETVTAPQTSKLTNMNSGPKPNDQTGTSSSGGTGSLKEKEGSDRSKSFEMHGITSPIKLTPISATLPSALTGQFSLPLPQPNNTSYHSTTQFTPNQSFTNNNSNNLLGQSGGLKVNTSFNRPLQPGENTPVNVFATRIVPDVYDSPSNFFATDSWANAQFGTGNTPFPYSALPTSSNNNINNNNNSNQLPLLHTNNFQGTSDSRSGSIPTELKVVSGGARASSIKVDNSLGSRKEDSKDLGDKK